MAFPAAPTYPAPGGGSSGGGSVSPVEPPAPTSQGVSSGASLSAKTFAAFTDSGSRIASYTATTTNTAGSTSWSGSGLGPYTASGSADGDAGTLSLTARDSSGNDLATAVHSYSRAAPTGPSWVNTRSIDLTALASTTLSAGSNTVSGVSIECEADGETVGGGVGLSAAATKYVFVDIGSDFTGVENPKLVVMKTTNAAWGGNGTSHAIRARLMSTTAGAAPSAQTRIYPTSGGAMSTQMQYQARYPTSSGTFTSVPVYQDSGRSAVLVWYHHLACIRGTWLSWVTEAPDVPADLADLLTPDARTSIGGINGYQLTGNSAYWPSTVLAGLFCQNSGSLATLDSIEVYEFR
jgi:hypothetical protein